MSKTLIITESSVRKIAHQVLSETVNRKHLKEWGEQVKSWRDDPYWYMNNMKPVHEFLKSAGFTLTDDGENWKTYSCTLDDPQSCESDKEISVNFRMGEWEEEYNEETGEYETIEGDAYVDMCYVSVENYSDYDEEKTYVSTFEELKSVLEPYIKHAQFQAFTAQHQSAFENACDDLHYGIGYNKWFETNGEDFDNEEDAKKLWKLAFYYMGDGELKLESKRLHRKRL